MYHVTVIRNDEAIDSRDFEIGSFVQIGYWLDYYGYIETDCKVVIQITT
jgi:hypothetical protein